MGTPLFFYLVMTKLKYVLGLFGILSVLVGCVEQTELSDVVVLATPKNDTTMYSNEKIRYQLQLFTINEYVDQFTVSSLDLDRGNIICLDTVFAVKSKELEYDFIYTAPVLDRESLDIELTFTVKDNLGNYSKIKRNVEVRNRQMLISEKSGIILYAHNPYLPNSILLTDVSQPYVSMYAPDSLKADIWVNPSDSLNTITWETETDAKFVRHNDFNYSAATAGSLQSTYLASKRYDAITDVAVNDIIIVGHQETVEGVFFVNNIFYNEELQCECLQLSFKGVATSSQP